MTETITVDVDEEFLDPRISRDLREALAGVSRDEARFLVDAYYQAQHRRIELEGQRRACVQATDASTIAVIEWTLQRERFIENQVKNVLKGWAEGHPASTWAMSICGIGPVLASGLRAHIDITQAPTVGHIWRFAGLDPTVRWESKQKRPWNAQLKVLCWKIGESFVKVSGRADDIYGKVYIARKALEQERNDAGLFVEQAAAVLERKKFRENEAKAAYASGKLPPGHIHARAKRYAVKLFLSHYHHVAYEVEYEVAPPKPYILTQPGHVHFVAPPNWPRS